MALPIQQFPILSFQQANPLLTGMQAGSGLLSDSLQNAMRMQQLKYLPQQMQLQMLLNQADIAQKYSQVPLNQARTALAGQQAQWVAPQAQGNVARDYAQANMANVNARLAPIKYDPAYQANLAAAKQQATSNVNQWTQTQTQASQAADLANQAVQLADQFKTNLDKSTYKGPRLGTLPTKGIFAPPGDLSAEQAADNASQNLAALVAKMIAGGRVTNYEMQYINNLKPNRTMTPQTAQMTADFLKQKSLRIGEQQQFLNAAKNAGVDAQTANTLWGMYNNQRHVYDFANNKANTQFQKTWPDYLKPQAIQAAQSGQSYVPIPKFANKQAFQAWYKTLNPSDQAVVRTNLGGQ